MEDIIVIFEILKDKASRVKSFYFSFIVQEIILNIDIIYNIWKYTSLPDNLAHIIGNFHANN